MDSLQYVLDIIKEKYREKTGKNREK
jgi:hypothetical protein